MTAPPGQLEPIDPTPRPAYGRARVIARYLAAAVFTAAAAVAAVPDLIGIDHRGPFARAVAFRPWVLVAATLVVLVLLLVAWRRRRARPTLTPFLVGGLAVLVAGVGMVAPRAIADPLPTGGTPLTVLAFNTFEGDADPAELAALIAEQQPDVVSLSEAGENFRSRIAPLVEPLGYRSEISSTASADVASVTVLVSDRLGDVAFRIGTDSAAFPYLEVSGGGLGGLTFVSFHAAAPTFFRFPRWRDDMALISQWCAAGTPTIVAGDLNATLDHSLLRAGMAGCADAADQRGEGLVPTWSPTESTELFGPQIDHVLATDGIAAETFSVHEIDGSDHRAILTRLRIPAAPG